LLKAYRGHEIALDQMCGRQRRKMRHRSKER
jgi:hypothetical protein